MHTINSSNSQNILSKQGWEMNSTSLPTIRSLTREKTASHTTNTNDDLFATLPLHALASPTTDLQMQNLSNQLNVLSSEIVNRSIYI